MGNNCCFVSLLKRKPSQIEPTAFGFERSSTKTSNSNNEAPHFDRIELTPDERTVILDTWRHIDSDFTTRGMRIFKLILSQPDVKAFFPFSNLSEEAMNRDPRFRAHACRFVQSVAAVIEELVSGAAARQLEPLHARSSNDSQKTATSSQSSTIDEIDGVLKVGQLLQTLGKTHSRVGGLDPEFFKELGDTLVVEAMVLVWKQDLGCYWSNEAETAWIKLFRYILGQVYEGLSKNYHKHRHHPRISRRASIRSIKRRNSQVSIANSGSINSLESVKPAPTSSEIARIVSAFRDARKWQEKTKAGIHKCTSQHISMPNNQ